MKLRNKKTGKIVERVDITIRKVGVVFNNDETYDTLAELNEEWEDYEEPKDNYFDLEPVLFDNRYVAFMILDKESTRKKAEKAVEKLKAWKRLKDKGFRFDVVPALGHCDDEKFDISIIATMPAKWRYNDKVVDDIHYVFGGEE